MEASELVRLCARDVVALLQRREVSPLELIDAALARIAAVNERVNAVVTLAEERARERARRLMERPPPDDVRGWLAGLPVLIKDLVEVEGVRTTFGSTLFRNHVPQRSDLLVRRIEERGGVVLGMTNTPEFGAGANTFNDVFGPTRNPFDLKLTAGGSSGGAAAALATGMGWLAHGSDLGGSLRVPAAYCAVVGLRPSPGRVPRGPRVDPFNTMAVEGPMARDVRDVALFLDTLAGFAPEDPLSFDPPAEPFAQAADRPSAPKRIAYSPDLGGLTPVDPEVADICREAALRFAEQGAVVEEAAPDLAHAVETFTVLRGASFAAAYAHLLPDHRTALKPEIVWNIEYGLALDPRRLGWAVVQRGRLQQNMAAFFRRYDLLLTPATALPPFPVEIRYIEELEGHRFATYVDWLTITYAITLTACPALALPCGWTRAGLPVGLQMVGPPRGEAQLLSAAALLEELLGLAGRLPVDPPPA